MIVPEVSHHEVPKLTNIVSFDDSTFQKENINGEVLAKVVNLNVAANFSLRNPLIFNNFTSQAKACGYEKNTFGRGSVAQII